MLGHFARAFTVANRSKPSPPTKQQRARLQKLVDEHGEREVLDRITRAFTDPPDWPRGPYDLAAILQHFDKFIARGRRGGSFHDAVMRSIEDDQQQPRRTLVMPWEEEPRDE